MQRKIMRTLLSKNFNLPCFCEFSPLTENFLKVWFYYFLKEDDSSFIVSKISKTETWYKYFILQNTRHKCTILQRKYWQIEDGPEFTVWNKYDSV